MLLNEELKKVCVSTGLKFLDLTNLLKVERHFAKDDIH